MTTRALSFSTINDRRNLDHLQGPCPIPVGTSIRVSTPTPQTVLTDHISSMTEPCVTSGNTAYRHFSFRCSFYRVLQ
jgi:hypothetical protein